VGTLWASLMQGATPAPSLQTREPMMSIEVTPISEAPGYLFDVKGLGNANSATLGLFPDGAFEDYAKRGHILVALDEHGQCAGYLLYRISLRKLVVTIVHLCVDEEFRRKGVGRNLVDHLKDTTTQFRGIGLRCRRDYEATKVWERLGFVPLEERPGRSQTGALLTYWWFDHEHPSLFSHAVKDVVASKAVAVLDANVFYDLQDEDDAASKESRYLLEAWLQDEVELCLTDEMFHEMNRMPDDDRRAACRRFAQRFTQLRTQHMRVDTVVAQVERLFPKRKTVSDHSDVRQLAQAIAGDADFFVTRDSDLLGVASDVRREFGLRIVRPWQLVVQLDELVRETDYSPERLQGCRMETARIRTEEDEDALAKAFQCFDLREKKSDFIRRMRDLLAKPRVVEARLIRDGARPIAFIAYDRAVDHELAVPFVRVRRGPIAATLRRHLLVQSVMLAAREGRPVTRVTEPFLPPHLYEALQKAGFASSDAGWVRFSIAVAAAGNELARHLRELAGELTEWGLPLREYARRIRRATASGDTTELWGIEGKLWPAKIADLHVPCFIVPIRPAWAMSLFDAQLAKWRLFGAEEELALSSENVYYRSVRPGGLVAPARVLWYVSHDEGVPGSKHLRACSRLDQVIVGKAKELFGEFRRFGVYEWTQVLELADNNVDNDIMVLRFSDTELLTRPIPWHELKSILREEENRGAPLQSPTRISARTFLRIYGLGRQGRSQGNRNG